MSAALHLAACLWLAAPALTTAPPATAAPASSTAAPAASITAAADLLTAGRHLEAALEYESAWHTTHEPAALLGAASAREALGQRAHAAAYLRELITRGDTSPELATRLATLERSLTPVQLRVRAPVRVRRLTIVATSLAPNASTRPPPLRLRIDAAPDPGAVTTLLLDPGPWQLAVDDGFYTAPAVTVRAPSPALAIQLTLRDEGPTETPWRPARLLVPGVLLGVGTGLLIGGIVDLRRNLARDPSDCPGPAAACRDLVTRGVALRSAGAGLLGAGFGGLAASMAYLSPSPRTRHRVWTGQAAFGLVAVIAGAVGVGLSARAYNDLEPAAWGDPTYDHALTRIGARHTGSAFVLGFATTLLLRSIGYLATHRWTERARRIDRSRSPGPIAHALTTGRF